MLLNYSLGGGVGWSPGRIVPELCQIGPRSATTRGVGFLYTDNPFRINRLAHYARFTAYTLLVFFTVQLSFRINDLG